MYLYETHLHTKESSGCARVPAAEAVMMYVKAGYSGIVVTDHFSKNNYRELGAKSWGGYIDLFLKGYRAAKAAAPQGFPVFLGIEIRFSNCNNDYLVFGAEEALLRGSEFIFNSNPGKFRAFCDKKGLLFIQAHPFRNNMTIIDPKYLHGIETVNRHPRHDTRNDIAELWAEKWNLIRLSGSDFHEDEDLALGGIYTKEKISSNQQFIDILKSGSYELK